MTSYNKWVCALEIENNCVQNNGKCDLLCTTVDKLPESLVLSLANLKSSLIFKIFVSDVVFKEISRVYEYADMFILQV